MSLSSLVGGLYLEAPELAACRTATQLAALMEYIDGVPITQYSTLGRVLYQKGRNAEAETLYRQALAGQTRAYGPDDERTQATQKLLREVLGNH